MYGRAGGGAGSTDSISAYSPCTWAGSDTNLKKNLILMALLGLAYSSVQQQFGMEDSGRWSSGEAWSWANLLLLGPSQAKTDAYIPPFTYPGTIHAGHHPPGFLHVDEWMNRMALWEFSPFFSSISISFSLIFHFKKRRVGGGALIMPR